MELLDKVAALGIEQRKMLREQREMIALQKEMALGVSELKAGLAELKAGHLEMLRMVQAVKAGMEGKGEEEVLMTRAQVMEMLFITKSTFYRRCTELNWAMRKIGKQTYYLRSSVIG